MLQMPQLRKFNGLFIKKMRLYTRGGDKGKTGLCTPDRVSKASTRISAIGDVDELNCLIGVCHNYVSKEISSILLILQNQLFSVGADIAVPKETEKLKWLVNSDHVKDIEKETDKYSSKINPQKNFVLPIGVLSANWIYLARSVCRRAERNVVRLMEDEGTNAHLLEYLNRLSSLLFVLARYENRNIEEPAPDYEARL